MKYGQKVLDDLDIGESRVLVEFGDTCIQGTYQGIKREKVNGEYKWSILVDRGRRKGIEYVLTSDILKLQELK